MTTPSFTFEFHPCTNIYTYLLYILCFLPIRRLAICDGERVLQFIDDLGLIFRFCLPTIITKMSATELSADDLKQILAFTVTLARKAGELIMEGSEAIQLAGSNVDKKKNSVDLVTEYDVRVEELVKKEIFTTYPDFKL